jgi:hypothetical protein
VNELITTVALFGPFVALHRYVNIPWQRTRERTGTYVVAGAGCVAYYAVLFWRFGQ